ncbi:MAG: sulfotransferase [Sandaracinaceae bacterium]|nr:sulfotransferase [Sandaracinaceae bacterium]
MGNSVASCPPPEPETYANDPRIAPIEQHLARFRRMVPTLDAIHPMGATLPQECLVTMAPSFRSYQFRSASTCPATCSGARRRISRRPTTFIASSCSTSSRAFGVSAGCRSRRRTWVSWTRSSPCTPTRVIQTHRDPVEVIPSVSSLHHVVRGFGSDGLDPRWARRKEYWGSALTRTMASRDQRPDLAQQFTDVHFEELLADPIAGGAGVRALPDALVPSTVDACAHISRRTPRRAWAASVLARDVPAERGRGGREVRRVSRAPWIRRGAKRPQRERASHEHRTRDDQRE